MGFGDSASDALEIKDLGDGQGGYRSLTLTIANMSERSYDDGDVAYFLHFQGAKKALRLNVTNTKHLLAMHGVPADNNDIEALSAHYRGKIVELFVDPHVQYKGATVGGLRIGPAQAQAGAVSGGNGVGEQAPAPPASPQPPAQAEDDPFAPSGQAPTDDIPF